MKSTIFEIDNERIEKERDCFKKILNYYFPDKERHFGAEILNICCGPVTEEPLLNEYFKASKLISVDYCPHMKEWAKAYGSKSFREGDLKKLDNIFKKSEKFNFLIGRNIPLSPGGQGTCPGGYIEFPPGVIKPLRTYYEPINENDEWLMIFKNLKRYLLKKSALFLTFLRSDEFYRAKEILKKADYTIIKAEENKHPCLSDRIGVANDIKDYYILSGRS